MQRLIESNDWKKLTENIKEEIIEIEKEILEDVSPTINKILYTQLDLKKERRKALKYVLALPKEIIEELAAELELLN